MLLCEHGASFAASTVWRFLDRHAMTHAAEQDRPDVALRRTAWREAQPSVDPARLVFIDETGASTKMARFYGRANRGRRCLASSRTAIGKPPPSLQACAPTGSLRQWFWDGPMNGEAFLAYVEQVLTYEIKAGDIVIPATNFVRAGTICRPQGERRQTSRRSQRRSLHQSAALYQGSERATHAPLMTSGRTAAHWTLAYSFQPNR